MQKTKYPSNYFNRTQSCHVPRLKSWKVNERYIIESILLKQKK